LGQQRHGRRPVQAQIQASPCASRRIRPGTQQSYSQDRGRPPTKPDLVPALGQQVLTLDTDWRSPIIDFIKNNKSYPKGKEHEKLARRSSNCVVIGSELFRHSASSGTLCKCISQDEGVRLLSDIHSGICGNHAGASTLVGNAFRSGFYGPTALADAQNLIRQCPGCQFFSKQQHILA